MSVPWSAVIGRSGTEYSKLSREQTLVLFPKRIDCGPGSANMACEVNGWGSQYGVNKRWIKSESGR